MKHLIFLIAISQTILENYCHLLGFTGGPLWKKRKTREGLDLSPKDIMLHLENKLLSEKPSHKKRPHFNQIPKETVCEEDMLMPSYAKAVCTTYPGRVVCQLGRYTFFINNGDHQMEPEVIERFAAMVYHRTQEGDSNFDVAVDTPVKEQQCLCPDPTVVPTTARLREAQVAPVYIECTPIKDERKLCNPAFSPSEVVYACKKKQIGVGKRMVISVDQRGTVRDGQLVLPYPSLSDKRFKRQKEFEGWRPPSFIKPVDVRNFTDECSTATSKWCPPSSRLFDDCQNNRCVTPPTTKCERSNPSTRAGSVVGTELSQAADANQEAPIVQNPGAADSPSLQGSFPPSPEMRRERSGSRATSRPPDVRLYTDQCSKPTVFPWCVSSIQTITECNGERCVTKDECGPQSKAPGLRREMEAGTFLSTPLASYRHKLLKTKELGFKRPIMMKRELKLMKASVCTTTCPTRSTPCPTPTTTCGPMPDPPKEVPCCQGVPPPKLPCCPNPPQPPSCPPQQCRKRRAPRNH